MNPLDPNTPLAEVDAALREAAADPEEVGQRGLQFVREQTLLRSMIAVSTDSFQASWHLGLERWLFRVVFCDVFTSRLDVDQVNHIKSAATLAHCWWHWPEGAECEMKISLDEARRLYG